MESGIGALHHYDLFSRSPKEFPTVVEDACNTPKILLKGVGGENESFITIKGLVTWIKDPIPSTSRSMRITLGNKARDKQAMR